MAQLVVNAGSSSLKIGCFAEGNAQPLVRSAVERRPDCARSPVKIVTADSRDLNEEIEMGDLDRQLEVLLDLLRRRGAADALDDVDMIGHRVVHGGAKFTQPTMISEKVEAEIKALSGLAPLHNPPALEGIAASKRLFPQARQYAVFDTSFFSALPEHQIFYPLPYEWRERFGIRRYGFHGISHEQCARRTAELMGRSVDSLNVITCHLGAGCSVTAVRQGRPIATSMGFTPLDGAMMKTRPGAIDPGILLHLLKSGRVGVEELDQTLQRNSGLKGISGLSGDVRDLEQAADRGETRSALALTMFADSIRAVIGGMAVRLGRLDALAFTGGVGEHSVRTRSAVCKGLEVVGLHLDPDRNDNAQGDAPVHAPQSPAAILVVSAREEAAIAQAVFTRARVSEQSADRFAGA